MRVILPHGVLAAGEVIWCFGLAQIDILVSLYRSVPQRHNLASALLTPLPIVVNHMSTDAVARQSHLIGPSWPNEKGLKVWPSSLSMDYLMAHAVLYPCHVIPSLLIPDKPEEISTQRREAGIVSKMFCFGCVGNHTARESTPLYRIGGKRPVPFSREISVLLATLGAVVPCA